MYASKSRNYSLTGSSYQVDVTMDRVWSSIELTCVVGRFNDRPPAHSAQNTRSNQLMNS